MTLKRVKLLKCKKVLLQIYILVSLILNAISQDFGDHWQAVPYTYCDLIYCRIASVHDLLFQFEIIYGSF